MNQQRNTDRNSNPNKQTTNEEEEEEEEQQLQQQLQQQQQLEIHKHQTLDNAQSKNNNQEFEKDNGQHPNLFGGLSQQECECLGSPATKVAACSEPIL